MSTLLACPDCGEASFSWMIEQVQFGNMHEFGDGSRDGEAMKAGPVTDDDISDNGVFCTTCDERKDVDDLVPINERN